MDPRSVPVLLLALALAACGSSGGAADPATDPADDLAMDLPATDEESSPDVAPIDLATGEEVSPTDLASDPFPTPDLPTSGAFLRLDGVSQQSLTIGGVSRDVILLAPPARPAHPALLIAFHGTSGSPTDWIDPDPGTDPMGLEDLATAAGIVVAAPRARDWGDGASDWDNHSGNDRYWETGFDTNPVEGRDPVANLDLVLVQAIIDAAVQAFDVDPSRVYLLGFSNGGFFTSLAAFVLSDRIAAFAEADSGLVACPSTGSCGLTSASTDCATILLAAEAECPDCDGVGHPLDPPPSARRVPAFVGHRNADDTVSVVHGCRLDARLRAAGFPVQTLITVETGHGLPDGFLDHALPYLLSQALP